MVVVDGMQGGTAATQTVFIEHVGIPTLAAVRQAVDALEELELRGKVQLIVSGGIRSGADVAKALALGADAVSIGQGMLIALGCNSDRYVQRRRAAFGRGGLRSARHGSRATAITATPGAARSASPRRTRSSSSGSSPTSAHGACATI